MRAGDLPCGGQSPQPLVKKCQGSSRFAACSAAMIASTDSAVVSLIGPAELEEG